LNFIWEKSLIDMCLPNLQTGVSMHKILLIEEDSALCLLLEDELAWEGYEVISLRDFRGIHEKILEEQPDLVLLTFSFGRHETIRDIRKTLPGVQVIVYMPWGVGECPSDLTPTEVCTLKGSDLSDLKTKVDRAMKHVRADGIPKKGMATAGKGELPFSKKEDRYRDLRDD